MPSVFLTHGSWTEGGVATSPWEPDARGPRGGAKSSRRPLHHHPLPVVPVGCVVCGTSSPAPAGVLRSPSSTLPSTWHSRWTCAPACRGDSSSHCPVDLVIEGWKYLTLSRAKPGLYEAQREPQILSPAGHPFPFPLHPLVLLAAFHPEASGNFSTTVVAPVAQHGHLSFRPSYPGPVSPRSSPLWLPCRPGWLGALQLPRFSAPQTSGCRGLLALSRPHDSCMD